MVGDIFKTLMEVRIMRIERFVVFSKILLVLLFSLSLHNANANSVMAKAKLPTVGIISGGVNGTYARFAQDISNILDKNNEDKYRILAVLGLGSQQNIADLLDLPNIGVAIVQSDVLAFADEAEEMKEINLKEEIAYITKLYNEEVHIIARNDIRSIKGIQGKKVAVGKRGSGTSMTAKQIFKTLGIQVSPIHMSSEQAVDDLKTGKIDAAVFVAGKPAPIFKTIKNDENLKFLSMQIDQTLARKGYLTSVLTNKDYPNLIEKDKSIDTLAVGAVMAVYNWKEGINRYDGATWFANNLFKYLPELQNNGAYHQKWKEVDFNTKLKSWTRFPPVEELLKKNKTSK